MLAILKRRLPDANNDTLLNDLLDEAEDFILAYTHRATLPTAISYLKVPIAAMLYNRMGMEGETAHTEGNVSRTAEALPDDIRKTLDGWRRAKPINEA